MEDKESKRPSDENRGFEAEKVDASRFAHFYQFVWFSFSHLVLFPRMHTFIISEYRKIIHFYCVHFVFTGLPTDSVDNHKEEKVMSQDSNTSARHFTRGGQIIFHNWRMLLQVNQQVIRFFLPLFLILCVIIFFFGITHDLSVLFFSYLKAKVASGLGQGEYVLHLGLSYGEYDIRAQSLLVDETTQEALSVLWGKFVFSVFISLVIMGVSASGFVLWITRKGKKQTENQFLRGSRLGDAKTVAKQMREDGKASDIEVSGFPMLKDSEVQHFLIHGTTGTGKGVTLSEFLDCIRARGDRAIIYDKGCTFTETFFKEGEDILLNPFDKRCANWNLWAEAKTLPEFESMAEAMIPSTGSGDPFWAHAARTIFSSVAHKIKADPTPSLKDLYEILITADLKLLSEFLLDTDAASLISEKAEKTSLSMRTMLTTYVKSFRFLLDNARQGEKFSIKEWIQGEGSNWLFVSSNAEQHESIKPLISMWLAMASTALLSMPEDRDRRIWFIIDELPSLHKIPHLPETIAEARKFGGCFVLGMQSFSQLEAVYGLHTAKSIFDLLNTRFFFRSPSSDMAKLVSRELGEQEIEDAKENYSYGANTIRDGISLGRQTLTRPLLTYPEIMTMENLKCFLKLPGEYPVVPLELKPKERQKVSGGFVSIS
jgi:type IV conjugative transfer system coupling protein TraD